ncbi:MAG: competence protein CoiA family protein [Candidatus Hodarchaeota archaeon]
MDSIRNVSESFEHLRIKEFLYANLPNDNHIDTIILEHPIGNRIADVYLKLENKQEVVVEIQHSKINIEDIKQRTRDYNEKGLYVIWILDGTSFNKHPLYEEGIFITKIEKRLHKMYCGRVYYMNTNKERIFTSIFPLHFAPYYKRRIISPNFSFYSRSKTRNSIIPGTLSSLNIMTFTSYGYKLARFLDPNIRKLCYEAVGNFVQNFNMEITLLKDSLKFDLGKALVYIVVRKFEPIFGLHLLYDILRRQDLLLKKDFHFLKSIHDFMTKE